MTLVFILSIFMMLRDGHQDHSIILISNSPQKICDDEQRATPQIQYISSIAPYGSCSRPMNTSGMWYYSCIQRCSVCQYILCPLQFVFYCHQACIQNTRTYLHDVIPVSWQEDRWSTNGWPSDLLTRQRSTILGLCGCLWQTFVIDIKLCVSRTKSKQISLQNIGVHS